MILAIFQMLQGVRFAPWLQSPYSQGQYPLALEFKSPANVHPNPLPTPTPAITPPSTLARIPILVLAWTEKTVVRPIESMNINIEESVPVHT